MYRGSRPPEAYHPTQETEQGKEGLLRPLNLLHVHAIQMLCIGGIRQFNTHLGTKLFGKLQVFVIGTAGRNGITVAAVRMLAYKLTLKPKPLTKASNSTKAFS